MDTTSYYRRTLLTYACRSHYPAARRGHARRGRTSLQYTTDADTRLRYHIILLAAQGYTAVLATHRIRTATIASLLYGCGV